MDSEDRTKISDVLLDGLAVQVAVDSPSRPEMVPHVHGYASQVTGESVDGGIVECRGVFEQWTSARGVEDRRYGRLRVHNLASRHLPDHELAD